MRDYGKEIDELREEIRELKGLLENTAKKSSKAIPHNFADMRICKSKVMFMAYRLIHTSEWVC